MPTTQTMGLTGTLSSPKSISGRLSNPTLRGERIELRVDERSFLQYRYEDETEWRDLIELNNLNYEELINKPEINGVELLGNLTPAQLGLSTQSQGVTTITRNGLTFTVTRPDGTSFTFDQTDTTYDEASSSSAGLMSASDKSKLDDVESGSQANIIESIKVNNVAQIVDNKAVNIAVPLVDDELTETGQAADAKVTGDSLLTLGESLSQTASSLRTEFAQADASLKSELEADIQSVADGIPTKTSDLTNDSDFATQTYVDGELAGKEDALVYTATSEDVGKAMMPKTVANGKVTEWEFGEAGKVDDVQVNGTSILNNKVANIPIANENALGVVRPYANTGITANNSGQLSIVPAFPAQVKAGASAILPIVPYTQHYSAFYGLAKAAGDTTQSSSSNAVGTYTDAAKQAIRTMLGVDTAIADAVGQITGFEFRVVQELPATGEVGIIYLVAHAHGTGDIYDEYIWVGTDYEKIGNTDIDLSNYAIKSELPTKVSDLTNDSGYATSAYVDGEIDTLEASIPTNNNQLTNGAGYQTENDVKTVVAESFQDGIEITVSGETPTITANANTRYICGTVTSLTFTPPSEGVTEVIFTAGTTVPTLTLPATVKMPEWFTIESGYTYAISIENATYGTVMMWQT